MFRHCTRQFALVAVLVATPVAAQQVPTVGLDEALRLFATNNLELRLVRLRAQQVAGLARQAGAFPNPTLDASHEPLSSDLRSYSETYLTASQRVELSGSRGARVDAGDRRVQAALLDVQADSARLAFEVKRAYLQALLAQERRAVTERIAQVFREASRTANERFAAGDVSLYALRRIDVERARYESSLADADVAVGSAQRTLALLVAPTGGSSRLAAVSMPPSPPVPAPVALTVPAFEARPELAGARADLAAEEAQARLMRAERVPDVTATGGLRRGSDGLRGVFLGLSVPLPVFDRGVGAVEAADAGRRAAEERLALTRRQVENDVRQAIETYEALSRRAQVLPSDGTGEANDLLDIALVAYDEGEMDLVELLDAADALHDARTAESGLRAAHWTAYFDLERALGGFGAQEDVQ